MSKRRALLATGVLATRDVLTPREAAAEAARTPGRRRVCERDVLLRERPEPERRILQPSQHATIPA